MTNTDVTKMAFFAPDPKLITIDLAAHEKRMTQMRADRDAANPPRSEGPASELRNLRSELFKVEQCAMNTEINTNNKAGEVKLLEHQLTEAINKKKVAVANGNALAERHCEHSIARLESEKFEAEKLFNRARRVSAEAARALKEWPHRERIDELQKIVG
jgi:hypothetical protein